MLNLTTTEEGVLVPLKVVPGASRDRICGEHDGAVKVAVSAAPEKGKANKAVIAVLARELGVRRTNLRVVRGATSPRKTVLISGTNEQTIRSRLGFS